MEKGKLYVVATPIGNLEDISFRAIKILKKVAFVLAEDTRESKKLLDRYDIETQLISYRDQNHERMINKILEKLNLGLDLALVSDNGTPLISDPGYKLIKMLKKEGFKIVSIPGPSAVVSAISISGLPTDRFTFLGFLPKSDNKRREIIEDFLSLETTLVVYESPNRLFKLLNLLREIDSNLYISAIRDMTKKHEQVYTDTVEKIIKLLEERNLKDRPYGEWVVLISKKI